MTTPVCRLIISTHAPLAGRDNVSADVIFIRQISTHAPLAGRDRETMSSVSRLLISTHAPLAGRDRRLFSAVVRLKDFNPRAPCGARPFRINIRSTTAPFQPTRPLRGATYGDSTTVYIGRNFNPRAPCGARQQKSTNHYAHFCDNRQISDAFAQNAACQGILLLFDAGKPCGFWVRTAQVISAHLCFAL